MGPDGSRRGSGEGAPGWVPGSWTLAGWAPGWAARWYSATTGAV